MSGSFQMKIWVCNIISIPCLVMLFLTKVQNMYWWRSHNFRFNKFLFAAISTDKTHNSFNTFGLKLENLSSKWRMSPVPNIVLHSRMEELKMVLIIFGETLFERFLNMYIDIQGLFGRSTVWAPHADLFLRNIPKNCEVRDVVVDIILYQNVMSEPHSRLRWISESVHLGRSLIYKMKRIGPRTEPCVTSWFNDRYNVNEAILDWTKPYLTYLPIKVCRSRKSNGIMRS